MDSKIEQESSTIPSILLVTGSLQGGGAERVLSEMANYWAKKGWAVVFATWSGFETDDFYELDPKVKRVRLDVATSRSFIVGQLKSNLLRIFALRKLLTDLDPDAVLSFIHTSNVLTILAAAGLRIRVVVSERMEPGADPTVSSGWRLLRRISYAWSDEIIAQSTDAARWIRQYCRKDPIIIPNHLRSLPQLDCERQPLIVAVGRLVNQKGFDLLLTAFAKIAFDFSDWNVAIIGEGKERDNLLRLCDKLSLATRVQFVGQVRNVESWMARAGLVVQPSRLEGFPNVLLESMGMGAPVISAACRSGPADMIQDGVNGRLVPVEDVTTLAQVMAELMAEPKLRESLGREASKVRESFRQDLIMDRWEKCLRGSQ